MTRKNNKSEPQRLLGGKTGFADSRVTGHFDNTFKKTAWGGGVG